MDMILGMPFLGEFITGLIVSAVTVRVRSFLHKTTMVVNTRGKKGFDRLPSWVKSLAYKALLEAQRLLPMAKQEDILEYACLTMKTAIKGKLDDIVIDVVKDELKAYLREIQQ